MDIKRNGSQPSGKGPAEWFTGNVRIDPLFQPNEKHWNGAAQTAAMTHIFITVSQFADWMEHVSEFITPFGFLFATTRMLCQKR